MTISSHSEPIGRTVAARKLSKKSRDRLGEVHVVKGVESISMARKYSKSYQRPRSILRLVVLRRCLPGCLVCESR